MPHKWAAAPELDPEPEERQVNVLEHLINLHPGHPDASAWNKALRQLNRRACSQRTFQPQSAAGMIGPCPVTRPEFSGMLGTAIGRNQLPS